MSGDDKIGPIDKTATERINTRRSIRLTQKVKLNIAPMVNEASQIDAGFYKALRWACRTNQTPRSDCIDLGYGPNNCCSFD